MTRILMATAACQRRSMNNDVDYDTVDRWIEMSKRIHGVEARYLYLNDIPKPRRSELFRMCESAGIAYDYADLGYEPDNRSHESREPIPGQEYERFAVSRNAVIESALAGGYDYIFNVDSDIICRENTVESLLPRMTPDIGMFAVLVNNLARYLSRSSVTIFKVPESQFKYNVCDYVQNPPPRRANMRPDYIRHTDIKRNIVRQVDISGACCLLSMEPFQKGLRYASNPNGEDCDICLKFRKAGFRTMIDSSNDLEALHLQEYWLYKNDALIADYLAGNRPDYFKFKAEP